MRVRHGIEAACVACTGGAIAFLLSREIPAVLYDRNLMDLWFDSDAFRVLSNLTDRTTGYHTTFKHPLFGILLWPPGALAMRLGLSQHGAAQALLTVNGAASALLLWLVLRLIGIPLWPRIACMMLFWASAAHLFWWGVVESFPFAASSILLGLVPLALMQSGRTPGLPLWIISGVATIAVTITNFAITLAAVAMRESDSIKGMLRRRPPALRSLAAPATIIVGALLAAALLAIVQDQLFGGASLFFNVAALAGESRFLIWDGIGALIGRSYTLLIQSVVASEALLQRSGEAVGTGWSTRWIVMPPALPASWAGAAAAALWVALLGLGVFGTILRFFNAPVQSAALVFLVFMLALHLAYGESPFLFAAHFAPVLVLVGAGALQVVGSRRFVAIVLPLAALALSNNIGALRHALALVPVGIAQVAADHAVARGEGGARDGAPLR